MKFCDKLQKIRRENNVTQEQLADKLNVSRQAVSKWESGQAYPDTEKLIAISKIFNVSLDELVNDGKDNNKTNSNKKFNFMETFNMVFEFISKSINMFWSMKFGEKIKFVLEMGILVLVIVAAAAISKNIVVNIVRRIFMFMPSNILRWTCYIVDTLIYILWIVLGCIIFVRVLKTRYLDYYIVITDDSVSEKVIEEPIKELKDRKEYKVVIRDPEHSSFNLLKKFGKLFIFCLKILGVFIAIPLVITFIFFMILLVISLAYLFSGLFFNGITLALIGIVAFIFLIIWFIYNLIFNQRNTYQKMFIIFIVSISLIGIGIGVSFMALGDFEIETVENNSLATKTKEITMSDDLIIPDVVDLPNDKIIIDDELSNIIIDVKVVNNFEIDDYDYYIYANEETYRVLNMYVNYDGIKTFNKVIDGIKNKKINTYNLYNNDGYAIDKISISSANLTKIKENYKKAYEE